MTADNKSAVIIFVSNKLFLGNYLKNFKNCGGEHNV